MLCIGIIGFLPLKGKLYYVYAQYDSFPEGAGKVLLRELYEVIAAGQLVILNPDDDPDPFIATNLETYYWYTYKRQGSFLPLLESGYLLESDSDDVAYSYILDFDQSLCKQQPCVIH